MESDAQHELTCVGDEDLGIFESFWGVSGNSFVQDKALC